MNGDQNENKKIILIFDGMIKLKRKIKLTKEFKTKKNKNQENEKDDQI
jgi:hypothetical protein